MFRYYTGGPNDEIIQDEENLVGKVCICSTVRIGIVTSKGHVTVEEGEYKHHIPGWHGIGLDGKGAWFSSNPVITAESAEEFRERIVQRFNGFTSAMG